MVLPAPVGRRRGGRQSRAPPGTGQVSCGPPRGHVRAALRELTGARCLLAPTSGTASGGEAGETSVGLLVGSCKA